MRVAALARIPEPDWRPGHRGIDLHAVVGAPVTAPAGGTVTFFGVVVDRPVVTVTHDDGRLSSLEPVEGTIATGTAVRAGDAIGVVAAGAGHCAPVVCVHWGVREDGRYVDPLDLLTGFGPVRLLPRERAASFRRRRRCAPRTRGAS
ncbi:M23 family metallopeptidase [Demequina sp. NBRC 110056]|uniref:M23 family metallopeptidase n=1 Tax=Demequina sp. NBRC 110056 TaxID=1570345 RepID=UPI000A042434|nr:M23 family metallopeptidase [Demequina sp. NBRC 110056]